MSDSGEKTEQATPRQLEKARERGEVFQSKDLTGAMLLCVAGLVIANQAQPAAHDIALFATLIFSTAADPGWSSGTALTVLGTGAVRAALAVLPLLAAVFAVALAIPFAQVGPLISLQALQPKLDKFNPINGFKRLFFSLQAYVELLKSALKVIVVGVIFYKTIKSELPTILRLEGQDPRIITDQVLRIGGAILTRAALFFLGIAVFDYFYQRWQYNKKMMMSREQVKQEYKEQEGNPEAKGHRKQLHQEILTQSMLHKVRKANVIVTNPDHIACAIRYDPNEEDAPRLLGKGMGYLAEKIKEIAREEDIPILRDVTLAHALHKLDEDATIPEELFDAVAEVLKWVELVMRAQGEVPAWLQAPAPKEEA